METGNKEETKKNLKILKKICDYTLFFMIVFFLMFLTFTNLEYGKDKEANLIIDSLNLIDNKKDFDNYMKASTYNNDKVIVELSDEKAFYTEAKGRITEDGEPYDDHFFYIFGYKFDYLEDYDEDGLFDSVRGDNDYPLWTIISTEVLYEDDGSEKIKLNGYSLNEKNILSERGVVELFKGTYNDFFDLNNRIFKKKHLFRVKILGILLIVIIILLVIRLVLKEKISPTPKKVLKMKNNSNQN